MLNRGEIMESFERDLYLRKFYDSELLGPMTGEITKDKPWVKNYVKNNNVNISINDTLYNNFKNTLSLFGEQIIFYSNENNETHTNFQFIENVDALAAGMELDFGLKVGDKIGIFGNNSIEEAEMFLAANKIGVCSKFIDFTKSIPDIISSINETELSLLVVDVRMKDLITQINSKNIPVVFIGPKELRSTEKINYDKLKHSGVNLESSIAVYDKDRPSVIITSSGTTGVPKPIVHTDYTINSAALKMAYTDYDMNKNNVLMKIIPSHIGLGLITTLYTGLLTGTKLVMISGNGPEESIKQATAFVYNFKKFVEKNKLNKDAKLLMYAAPMFYRMINSFIDKIDDLSYMGTMLAAGSSMSSEELEMLNASFKKKGCKSEICNGYGQNEMAGAVSLNTNNANVYGSAGYPVIGTDVIIVDPKTYEPLKIGQVGKILEKSSSSFKEYENLEAQTKKSFVKLEDGSTWFDTNDLGYMNEDGFLFITGRTSRVLIKFDCKISLDKVEEKIRILDGVKECAIVLLKGDCDEKDVCVAYIEAKDAAKVNELFENGKSNVSDLEMPTYIEYVEKIPVMPNGKIDYVSLTNNASLKYGEETKKI